MSDRIWSDIGDGARDVTGHALTDVQNHYQQFLTGRPAPMTSLPGVMETTTETSEPLTGPPESMRSALLKHAAAEGAEREAEHWRQAASTPDAGSDPGAGGDPTSGMDAYRTSFNAEPLAGAEPGAQAPQGFYGVGQPAPGSQPTQDTQTASPAQPEQSYGPEL
jgi:hypothetical protein